MVWEGVVVRWGGMGECSGEVGGMGGCSGEVGWYGRV